MGVHNEESVLVDNPDFDASRLYQMGTAKRKVFEEYNKWHCRFGHVNGRKLRYLHEVSTLPNAVSAKSPIEYKCDACNISKARKNRNHELAERAQAPLDLVAADICGPFPESKHWEEKYFLEAIDNYTRRSVVFTAADRKECAEQMFQWKKTAELQTDKRLKAIRLDNAKELESKANEWAAESGVHIQPTAPYTSSQNGTAERALQSTQAMMRSMLAHAQLPEEYWNLAVMTASFLRNRLPDGPDLIKDDGSRLRQCPEQAWFKKKPRLSSLRIFGSKCFVYVDKPQSKASQRAEIGIFLGYHGASQYWVEILETGILKRVDAARVVVDESTPGGTLLPDSTIRPLSLSLRVGEGMEAPLEPTKDLAVPALRRTAKLDASPNSAILTAIGNARQAPSSDSVGVHKGKSGPSTGDSKSVGDTSRKPGFYIAIPPAHNPADRKPAQGGSEQTVLEETCTRSPAKLVSDRVNSLIEFPAPANKSSAIPSTRRSLRIQEASKSTPNVVKRRAQDDIAPEESKKTKLTPEEVEAAIQNSTSEIDTVMAHIAFLARATEADQVDGIKNRVPIPTSYWAAINDPIHGKHWRTATLREISEVQGNRTWQEEKLPRGANEVTSKWVFTVKYNIDSSIERYKARLVARGFTQIYGQDFEETFAPTIRIDSLRMLMAIAAVEDMEAEQVDVNNAFTESKLRETIYMKPPPGVSIKSGSTLRLLQSLYGLKQSAREWYLRCSKVLKKMGFKPINADPCVFIRKSDNAIIGLYVDDLIILTPKDHLQSMADIKDELSSFFKIKELGAIKRVLGIRIHRVRSQRRIYLDQQAYIEKFLHEFAIENPTVKPTCIPISDANSLHHLQDNEELGEIRDYQRRIGSMMFAMVYSRPDICFAMSKLSQYMSGPSVHHESAVKHLLRYLRTTKDFRICYRAQSRQEQIVGYSDADFAADKDDRRSVSGFVFKFAGGPISWASRKQKSVTTSTAEAELMALVPATKHAIWLSKFLNEIGRPQFIGADNRTVVINEDNQAAIKMVNNNQITERSKHVDIGCHFVRERFENQDIDLRYCHTDKMAADGCTKGLAKAKFSTFLKLLGLKVIKEESAYNAVASWASGIPPLGLTSRHPPFQASSILGIRPSTRYSPR